MRLHGIKVSLMLYMPRGQLMRQRKWLHLISLQKLRQIKRMKNRMLMLSGPFSSSRWIHQDLMPLQEERLHRQDLSLPCLCLIFVNSGYRHYLYARKNYFFCGGVIPTPFVLIVLWLMFVFWYIYIWSSILVLFFKNCFCDSLILLLSFCFIEK